MLTLALAVSELCGGHADRWQSLLDCHGGLLRLADGRADFMPVRLSQIPGLYAQDGLLPLDALLLIVRRPKRVPDAIGANLTLTSQEAPAAMDVPQVLVHAKSPVIAILETVTAALPVFVTVTVRARLAVCSRRLANVREAGATESIVSLVLPRMPVPLRATTRGLLLALLVTVRVPARGPGALGLNVTVTAQEPSAAMLPQLLVWLKSPVTATFVMVAAVVPESLTVTVLAAAVEPSTVRANDRLAGTALSTTLRACAWWLVSCAAWLVWCATLVAGRSGGDPASSIRCVHCECVGIVRSAATMPPTATHPATTPNSTAR